MPTPIITMRLSAVALAQISALIADGYAKDRTAAIAKAVEEVYTQQRPKAKRKKSAEKS